jgi:hypothetical protein
LGLPETVYGPSGNAPASSGGAGSNDQAGRNQRYNYLVGRLRNRQITMEEATELFTLMQTMIARANDLARAAAYRTPSVATPTAPGAMLPPPPPRVQGPGSSADDLLLVGILAMGAGAGLLAALSKRMGDTSPPAPSGSGRSTPSATSR